MFDALKARLCQHEGRIPHLYLDTLGLVTCAVGHLVPSAEAMASIDMVHLNGVPATFEEKKAEWERVKALEPSKLPAYYAQRTTLRMTDATIDALQNADIATFHSALSHQMTGFDQFPQPVQEALLDMAFQLGAGGLVHKFPLLCNAVKAHDWDGCAEHCHRAGIQEWRNTATAALFREGVAA